MITSTVIVLAGGVCEISVAFYEAARHRTPTDFETLFV
jgi:hypothetical protein